MYTQIRLYAGWLLLLLPAVTAGQAIDSAGYTGQTGRDRYLQLSYENDLFNGTDRYYTQGCRLAVAFPGLRRLPLYRLLLQPRDASTVYGLALASDAYTPTTIERDEVLYGDRPYAATVYGQVWVTARDAARKAVLTSSLAAGIIGPAAGGYELQRTIHRYTGNKIPLGWEYQIRNDLVLNYAVSYEKELWSAGRILLINGLLAGRAGTLSTRGSAGIVLMGGHFLSPFAGSVARNGVQYYAFFRPSVHIVGYDATLQGGLFARNNSYTIAAADMSRLVYEHQWGVVCSWKSISLCYSGRFLTREFRTGGTHRTGSFTVCYGF